MDKKLESMSCIIVFDFLNGLYDQQDLEEYIRFLYQEIDFTKNEMKSIRDIYYYNKGEDSIVLKIIKLILNDKTDSFNRKDSNNGIKIYIDSIVKITYIKNVGFVYMDDYEFDQKFFDDIKKDFEKNNIDKIKMIIPVIGVIQKDKPISIINYSNGGETIEWLQTD